jgi:hypothetical protein
MEDFPFLFLTPFPSYNSKNIISILCILDFIVQKINLFRSSAYLESILLYDNKEDDLSKEAVNIRKHYILKKQIENHFLRELQVF